MSQQKRSSEIGGRAVAASLGNPRLMEAALALYDNRLSEAEPLLKAHLRDDPFDAAAIRNWPRISGRPAPIWQQRSTVRTGQRRRLPSSIWSGRLNRRISPIPT
jgi:hypothetical protein